MYISINSNKFQLSWAIFYMMCMLAKKPVMFPFASVSNIVIVLDNISSKDIYFQNIDTKSKIFFFYICDLTFCTPTEFELNMFKVSTVFLRRKFYDIIV
jgi:alkyl hydroperoxide reductase subunit AhpC